MKGSGPYEEEILAAAFVAENPLLSPLSEEKWIFSWVVVKENAADPLEESHVHDVGLRP